MGKTKQPHDTVIRARLLNSLGIYKKDLPIRSTINNDCSRRKYSLRGSIPQHHHHHHPHHVTAATVVCIWGKPVIPRQEPLKDQTPSSLSSSLPPRLFWNPSSSFSPRPSSMPTTTTTTTTTASFEPVVTDGDGNRAIHFDSKVSVVVIPSRYQYSNRIKQCLWSNSSEIRENAERNTQEFRSEGWDWHSVLEDDDMYINASTGELVHPVWVDGDSGPRDNNNDDEDNKEEEENESDSSVVSVEWDGPETPTLTRSLSGVADGLNQMMIAESLSQMVIDNM